jgi:hypothetical protein
MLAMRFEAPEDLADHAGVGEESEHNHGHGPLAVGTPGVLIPDILDNLRHYADGAPIERAEHRERGY